MLVRDALVYQSNHLASEMQSVHLLACQGSCCVAVHDNIVHFKVIHASNPQDGGKASSFICGLEDTPNK